ncbi:MAG: DNA repair protein RecN [Lactobacillales bacterium]|nr:DNA repair protein RecN [Lactobacillales bacterium]
MLQELVIENFTIISKLSLSFQSGMSALTGETGAGKSIIIDAVNLLIGGRSQISSIRFGSKKAVLQGLFSIQKDDQLSRLLETYGIDLVDDSLLLQRELMDTGRTNCRVNGRLVNTSILREIGRYLVDIHGQYDHQKLINEHAHLELLDSFGGEKLQQQKKHYQQVYTDFKELEKKVTNLRKNEQEFAQRIDLLRFQKMELEEAALQMDEEDLLFEEHEKLANFQKISSILTEGFASLIEGDKPVLDHLARTQSEFQKIADFGSEFQKISENISSAYYLLQEATTTLNREIEALFYDEERLNEVDTRLELLKQLKRKYGESLSDIIRYYEEISFELEEKEDFVHRSVEWENSLAKKYQLALQEGEILSKMRAKVAQSLTKEIEQELKELYMDKTTFKVRFQPNSQKITESGLEEVQFLIAPNIGEGLKSLAKIASGGEMSRVLLALTSIFSDAQKISTLIFDEIDTGVSGRVAEAIAKKISKLSKSAQVLCITHLPQVAAYADNQFLIEKDIQGERTQVRVQCLQKEARIQEIARMLSGENITSLSLEHAKEWLEEK